MKLGEDVDIHEVCFLSLSLLLHSITLIPPMYLLAALQLAQATERYSGAELKSLCNEAALGALREQSQNKNTNEGLDSVGSPSVLRQHFVAARAGIQPSIEPASLLQYAHLVRKGM